MTPTPSPRFFRPGLAAGLVLLASAGLAAAQAASDGARCTYTNRMICTTEGCQPTDTAGIHLRLPALPELRDAVAEVRPIRVERCDPQGCSSIEITNTQEAGILTLSAMEGSYLIKLYDGPEVPEAELKTGQFTEVLTSMFTVFVGQGVCTTDGS